MYVFVCVCCLWFVALWTGCSTGEGKGLRAGVRRFHTARGLHADPTAFGNRRSPPVERQCILGLIGVPVCSLLGLMSSLSVCVCYSGRNLTWQTNMGTADIRATLGGKRYELQVGAPLTS